MTDTDTPAPAPAPTTTDSSWFWRVLGALMLLSVAWMLWLMWQITPRSLVTDLALRRAGTVRTAPAAPRPEMAAETPKPQTPTELQQGDPVGLKLSTELKPAAKAEPAPARASPAK